MNSRVIIFLVAAAILLAVLVPVVLIATILLFVTPALLIAHEGAGLQGCE
ncbi:MAG: hypothetical protein JO093_05770 [Acidobacteria bacterium]|nr:hypothetical protein [Acidobacteriota bacterium]MBV9185106.1 hypothetical protein [Acidobacteriota bacterium]